MYPPENREKDTLLGRFLLGGQLIRFGFPANVMCIATLLMCSPFGPLIISVEKSNRMNGSYS